MEAGVQGFVAQPKGAEGSEAGPSGSPQSISPAHRLEDPRDWVSCEGRATPRCPKRRSAVGAGGGSGKALHGRGVR